MPCVTGVGSTSRKSADEEQQEDLHGTYPRYLRGRKAQRLGVVELVDPEGCYTSPSEGIDEEADEKLGPGAEATIWRRTRVEVRACSDSGGWLESFSSYFCRAWCGFCWNILQFDGKVAGSMNLVLLGVRGH